MRSRALIAVLFILSLSSCSVKKDDDFTLAEYSLSDVPAMNMGSYGILTPSDLAEDLTSYDESYTLHWLCVPTSEVYLGCDDYGVDEISGEHYAYANFSVQVSPHVAHHFDHRRGTDMEGCQEYVKEWARIMEGQQQVCILGSMGTPSIQQLNGHVVLDYAWTLYRVKTKRACYEWGVDFDCSVRVPLDLKYAPGT